MRFEFLCKVSHPVIRPENRALQGDIISIRKYPFKWANQNLKRFLVIHVSIRLEGLSELRLREKLEIPLLEGGRHPTEFNGLYSAQYADGKNVLEVMEEMEVPPPPREAVWDEVYEEVVMKPKVLAKSRYCIPFKRLKAGPMRTLVIDKAKMNMVYQPCMTEKHIENCPGNEYTAECVDCGVGPNKEVILRWHKNSKLVMDKYTGEYIGPEFLGEEELWT
jgi:hypothetical protein